MVEQAGGIDHLVDRDRVDPGVWIDVEHERVLELPQGRRRWVDKEGRWIAQSEPLWPQAGTVDVDPRCDDPSADGDRLTSEAAQCEAVGQPDQLGEIRRGSGQTYALPAIQGVPS